MAYIDEFTINGLAGRKDVVHRKLDRHVNIFWGLNGTGKTSLLKILHAAMSNDVSSLEGVPFERAEVVFWSTDNEARYRRTYTAPDFRVDEDDDDGDDEYIVELQPDGTYLHTPVLRGPGGWTTELLEGGGRSSKRPDLPFRHGYLPISRMSQLARRTGAGPRPRVIDDAYLDEQFAEQVQQRWQAYNAQANVQIRQIQQLGLASILAHLFGGGFGGSQVNAERVTADEAYGLVSSFLRQQGISLRFGQAEFLRRYEGEPDLRRVVANIQEVSEEVRKALRPQDEFQALIGQLYSGGKQLLVDTQAPFPGGLRIVADGKAIPLRALSSGEKQLLRLMLEALAAGTGTVMIDEPELSMHVDWQQGLVASMRKINPDCQLLLATHSPEVMAEVNDDLVFEL